MVLLVWAISRVLYYGVGGLAFNSEPAFTFWQNIDPKLLQTDLLRSLWNLHMQPPAYNMLIGVLMKLSAEHFSLAYWGMHLAMGVMITLFLYWLMLWFGLGPSWSVALTGAFIASPACVLFESVAVYEYPILLLLLGGTVALARFIETGAGRALGWFGGCLFGLMLMRNLFHVGYAVMIGLGLWLTLPMHRRRIARVFVLLLVLILGLYLKNQILFGRFTASTWMGMQTGFMTSYYLTASEAESLIARGLVTPLIRIRPFSPIEDYIAFRHKQPPHTGVPVLDETRTSRGYSNFNALAYLDIHEQYAANSKIVFRYYPIAYLRSLAGGWFSYFRPASDMPYYFSHEPEGMRRWEKAFNQVFFGQIYRSERSELVALRQAGQYLKLALHTGVVLVVVLPLVILWGFDQLLRKRARWEKPQVAVLGFILFTIIVQAFVGNFLACCENNRYRFPLDPYFVLLAGLAGRDVVQTARAMRKRLMRYTQFRGSPI